MRIVHCKNAARSKCFLFFLQQKQRFWTQNTLQQNFKLQASVASMSIWTLFQSSLLLSVELVSELCNRIQSCQRAHDDVRVLVYLQSWSGNKRFHQQIHLYKNLWVWDEEQQKLHWWIWSEREEEEEEVEVGGEAKKSRRRRWKYYSNSGGSAMGNNFKVKSKQKSHTEIHFCFEVSLPSQQLIWDWTGLVSVMLIWSDTTVGG